MGDGLVREMFEDQEKKVNEDLERRVLEAVREHKTVRASDLSRLVSVGENTIIAILHKYELSPYQQKNKAAVPIIVPKPIVHYDPTSGMNDSIQKEDNPTQKGDYPAQKEDHPANYSAEQREGVLEAVMKYRPVALSQLEVPTGVEREVTLEILRDAGFIEYALTMKRRPEIDELVADGFGASEIGRRRNVSHAYIFQYICGTNQRDFHEEQKKRKEEEKRKKEKQRLEHFTLVNLLPNEQELLASKRLISEGTERTILEAVRKHRTVNNQELRKHTCLSYGEIREVLRKHEISYVKLTSIRIVLDQPFYDGKKQLGGYTNEQRNEVLTFILEKDPITIYQIRKGTELDKETILNILKDEQLVCSVSYTTKRNPERDRRIAEGGTLREMSTACGGYHQLMHQYIVKTGQYDFWVEQSEKKEAEKKASAQQHTQKIEESRTQFVQLCMNTAYQQTDASGWKYRRKALDYYFYGITGSRKSSNYIRIPLENLTKLFDAYETAEQRGEKLSLEELSELSGISYCCVIGKILKSTGLEPMHGAREKISPLPKDKKAAIRRAYYTDFPSTDVAYFLGIEDNYWIVSQHFSKIGRERGEHRGESAKHCLMTTSSGRGTLKHGDVLQYRHASQIYEFDDMAKAEHIRFSDQEIGKLFGLNSKCVEYAIEHRGWIQDDILNLLTLLYGRRMEKPYLEK